MSSVCDAFLISARQFFSRNRDNAAGLVVHAVQRPRSACGGATSASISTARRPKQESCVGSVALPRPFLTRTLVRRELAA
jgi:hypothetical protein